MAGPNLIQRLFGFRLEPDQKPTGKERSFVAPESDETSLDIHTTGYTLGGAYGKYLNIEGFVNNENALIEKYREIAMVPEVDNAIEEIVSDMVISDDENLPVELDLADLDDLSDELRDVIREEFESVLNLMSFKTKGHDIVYRWYVDGRINYHKVIDEKSPKDGIKELRYIDPRKIKKVREIEQPEGTQAYIISTNEQFLKMDVKVKEYYVYNDEGIKSGNTSIMYQQAGASSIQGIKIATDSIAHANSGKFDAGGKLIVSHLHKAIRVANQMRMLEDAGVIYTITRAPEKLAFYVGTANLPKGKADQYIRDLMNKFKSRLVYDSSTGEVRDERKHFAMTENYWLARRADGQTTEIQPINGGQALQQIVEIVEYFKNKLYKALNVPVGRLDQNAVMSFGKGTTEISREELKFAKFVARLRARFNMLFHDLLSTQLHLKGIMTRDEYELVKEQIKFNYARDNYFKELKDNEILNARLETLTAIQPYIGVYFTSDWVKRNVLRQTDEEIEALAKENASDEANAEQTIQQIGQNVFALGGGEAGAEVQAQQMQQQAQIQGDQMVKQADMQQLSLEDANKQLASAEKLLAESMARFFNAAADDE